MTIKNISHTAVSPAVTEPPEGLIQLVSLRAWLVLGAVGCVLVLLLLWAFLGELRTTVEYMGVMVVNGSPDVVVYLPIEAAESTRAGMNVQIKPFASGEPTAIFQGHLVEVGALPASPTEMRAVLGDEILVENVLADGPVVQTRVLCDEIPGEAGIVMSKVMITTRVEHPINRLFPDERSL